MIAVNYDRLLLLLLLFRFIWLNILFVDGFIVFITSQVIYFEFCIQVLIPLNSIETMSEIFFNSSNIDRYCTTFYDWATKEWQQKRKVTKSKEKYFGGLETWRVSLTFQSIMLNNKHGKWTYSPISSSFEFQESLGVSVSKVQDTISKKICWCSIDQIIESSIEESANKP